MKTSQIAPLMFDLRARGWEITQDIGFFQAIAPSDGFTTGLPIIQIFVRKNRARVRTWFNGAWRKGADWISSAIHIR
jgi:hypothetical protein